MKSNNTYGKVYQNILRSDKLTWKGRLIYAMLCTYKNNETDKCWPSLTRLTKDLEISKPSVIDGIKELVKAEIIMITSGKNNRNEYALSSKGDLPLDESKSGQVVKEIDHSSKGGLPLSSKGDLPKHIKENSTNNINIAFEVFWNLYDKKKGSKKACEKKWNNLKDSERQKAIDTIPIFKAGISDKQYQPYPKSYINEERWNDEIDEILKPASMRIL